MCHIHGHGHGNVQGHAHGQHAHSINQSCTLTFTHACNHACTHQCMHARACTHVHAQARTIALTGRGRSNLWTLPSRHQPRHQIMRRLLAPGCTHTYTRMRLLTRTHSHTHVMYTQALRLDAAGQQSRYLHWHAHFVCHYSDFYPIELLISRADTNKAVCMIPL